MQWLICRNAALWHIFKMEMKNFEFSDFFIAKNTQPLYLLKYDKRRRKRA